MRLFAVRTIETHRPVGFFWVNDIWELAVDVDAVCDPGICEYKPIDRPAALTWQPDDSEWKMGVATGADPNDPNAAAAEFELVKKGIDFHGALDDFTIPIVDLEDWTAFDAPAEGWSDPLDEDQ
jgi:hypothetical protein